MNPLLEEENEYYGTKAMAHARAAERQLDMALNPNSNDQDILAMAAQTNATLALFYREDYE